MAVPISAVVFDLDGTLIDSVCDIADVLNDCLCDVGLAAFDESVVITMIGGGARLLIERALARIDRCDDTALLDRMHHEFERRYAGLGAGRSRVFPGGVDLLRRLRADGMALGICTNKPAAITARVLDELDLTRWFGAIVGETAALPRKPDPAMLLAAIAGLGASPASTVMIGDSSADVGTAKAAGVRVVAVSFGYTTIPPRELGADLVIDHLSELPSALAGLR